MKEMKVSEREGKTEWKNPTYFGDKVGGYRNTLQRMMDGQNFALAAVFWRSKVGNPARDKLMVGAVGNRPSWQ